MRDFSAAQFLEAKMAAAWTILERHGERVVVAQHGVGLRVQVCVLNFLAVQSHHEARATQFDAVAVPLRRLVELLARRECAIEAAGEFGVFGFGIVAKVRHLQLHAVEGRIALHRRAQREAAVARLAELEFIFEDEVAVFLFAHQPRATLALGLQHALRHTPDCVARPGLAHVIPHADAPASGNAILRKERAEGGRLGRSAA